jgi:hypothetical protein
MNSLALMQDNSYRTLSPENLQANVIGEIRKRGGLDLRPPSYEEYYEKE